MTSAKVILPLVGLGIAGVVALTSRSANASPGSGSSGTASGTAGGASGTATVSGPPLDIINRMVTALSSGDPAKLRAEADKLQRDGYPTQAADLRAAATAIESGKAVATIPPNVVASSPGIVQAVSKPAVLPAASVSPTAGTRTVTVLRGEGPSQITARLLGSGARWKELVAANVPPKKRNASTGNFTSLNPGEVLRVPASWPITTSAAPAPAPAVSSAPVSSAPVASVGQALPALAAPAVAAASVPTRRLVTVLKGEGPYQVTARVLGASQAGRWKELVAANVPPKKRDPKSGNFTTLNAGEKLVVPAHWPNSSAFTIGADPLTTKSIRAGKIALGLHFGRLHPDLLREWQKREGINPSGKYCPQSALVLCYRYGFVPPVPSFGSRQELVNFAEAIARRAKKDPQRQDEYRKLLADTKKAS